ncbi:hypothetical protein BH23ACT11_BH23ACT11_07190 [soil metagenome]
MIKNFAAFIGLLALFAATVTGMLAVVGIIGGDVSQKGRQFVQTNKQVKEESLGNL